MLSTTVADRARPLRLHTFKTDWNTYKTTIAEKLNTKKKLKTEEDIEAATMELISILQQAAKTATPLKNYPVQVNNLPSHIKHLVVQKRRARATWQKCQTPEDKRNYNRANNKLKQNLQELQNATFANYISTLRREDHTIWKPIKSKKKPRTPIPPLRRNMTPPSRWAKSDSEKANLFAEYLAEVFTPHENTPDRK